MKKIIASIIVIGLLLMTSIAGVNAYACKPLIVYIDDDYNSSTPGWGYDHFDKIQDGVNNVLDNGIVKVSPGTYYENINIYNTLSLIGVGEGMRTINGDGIRNVVNITTNWVNINGFKIIGNGCEYGIYAIADNITIAHNHISGNIIGVYLNESADSTLFMNNITENYGIGLKKGIGIYISNSRFVDAIHNNISKNHALAQYENPSQDSGIGIVIENSENINVEHNNIFENYGVCEYTFSMGYSGIGLSIESSENVNVENNNIFENYGVSEHQYSMLYTGIGIVFDQSDNNNIRYNNIYANYQIGSGAYGGTGMAIAFSSSNYNNVSYNQIYENIGESVSFDITIELQGSYHNDFYCNNIFENGGDAIILNFADNNNIINNDINNNSGNGLNLYCGCDYNNVLYNNIVHNSYNGIRMFQSASNLIKFNTISENSENGLAIESFNYQSSENNVISNNIISKNMGDGVLLDRTNNQGSTRYNHILNNEIFENSIGIRIANYSNNNEVRNNSIRDNSNCGVDISSSCYSNVLYHNSFESNVNQANDVGTNTWDNGYPSGGNYWDDYTGIDSDGDGIGDTPYNISGGSNQDLYPFMKPNGWINLPPNKPTLQGPTTGKPGVKYTYFANTTDPNENKIFYKWSWGDGIFSEWIGPYDSGFEVSASHAWSQGSYEIKVKAKDTRDLESDWSEPLPVTIPRNRIIDNFILIFFGNHPLFFKILQFMFKGLQV